MKYFNRIPACVIVFLLLMLCACEPVAKIQVQQPAAVFPPDHVKTIMVINRSHYGSDVVNDLVGGLLNSLLNSDKVGGQNAAKRQVVKSFSKHLAKISRFKVKLSKTEMDGTGEVSFPAHLPWEAVDSICNADSCDALAALEYYDAGAATSSESQSEVITKDKDNKDVHIIQYTLNGTTTIKLGWRLYDSKTHIILDEFADTRSESWTKTANSKSELKSLMINIDATQISNAAGAAYADCFIFLWVTYSRKYYSKGNDLLKKAATKSKSGDWDGAVEIWKDILTNGDTLLMGKAAYNMAVACEVKGKLDLANEWAEKSYSEFGNQEAKEYLFDIEGRIDDQKRLNDQKIGREQ